MLREHFFVSEHVRLWQIWQRSLLHLEFIVSSRLRGLALKLTYRLLILEVEFLKNYNQLLNVISKVGFCLNIISFQ